MVERSGVSVEKGNETGTLTYKLHTPDSEYRVRCWNRPWRAQAAGSKPRVGLG